MSHCSSDGSRLAAAALILLGLSACEPSYSLAWSRSFNREIEVSCIYNALKSISPVVTQGQYVSDGARGFPVGTRVTQFGYADPDGKGHFSYDIARIGQSYTRVYHSYQKLGNLPSEEDARRSSALLAKANSAVARTCNVKFSPSDFQADR